jgi:hypothetical protein
MTKEYIINHPSQLNGLSTLPFKRNMAIGKIRLSGNMAEHPQREYFEKELNRRYHACGCDTGAKGLLIGLLLGLGYSFYRYNAVEWPVSNGVIATLATLLIMSGAGKLYGLYAADKKLKDSIEDVKKQWMPEKEYKEEKNYCG